jgi:hypothetical protein
MSWISNHTLRPDEFYEILIRYTQQGGAVILPVRVQRTYWWVDPALYLQADQETGRAYYWSVRVVRKAADTASDSASDTGENDSYLPLSPPSEEWVFYWR